MDHVIIATQDLTRAAERFRERLGLHVSPGGRHPGRGTENCLVHFDLSYFELMGIHDAELARRSWPRLLEYTRRGGGLFCVVLGPADADEAVRRLQAAGSSIGDVEPGERLRPDGWTVRWRMARVRDDPDWPFQPPFLCRHLPADPERRRWLEEVGAIAPHPLAPSVRFVGAAIACWDLAAVLERLQRTFGLQAGAPYVEPALGARGVDIPVGANVLSVLQPDGPGLLRRHLEERGEGPFLVTLAVPDVTAAARELRRRGTAVQALGPARGGGPFVVVPPEEASGTYIHLAEEGSA